MNKKVKVGLLGIALVAGSVGWSAAATAATDTTIQTTDGMAMTVADVAFDIGAVMTAPVVNWAPGMGLTTGAETFGTLTITNAMGSAANITIVPLVKSGVNDASIASEFTKVVDMGAGKSEPVDSRDGKDKLNVILVTSRSSSGGQTYRGAEVGAPAMKFDAKESIAYEARLGYGDSSKASTGRWKGGWVVYATQP
ncbi:hypothetical protein LL645_004131 [Salmonella enterica]|nr:hypothetical protein [Salmonella enterica]